MATWQISGEYMETCNCTLLCPCITSNLAAQADRGRLQGGGDDAHRQGRTRTACHSTA